MLVLVEMCVLLAGVISRFVFHHPFVWSDELASILFLWLAMFGAVVALQRQQHMRLTAIVSALSPHWRARSDVLAMAVPAVFLLLLMSSARDYAADEWFIETPALGWSNIVRAAAIPVGFAIMLLGCVLRLLRLQSRDILMTGTALAALALALYFAAPALKAMGNWNLLVFFVGLLGTFVLLGVPIGFAFGTATVAFLACVTRVPLSLVVSRMDEGMSSLVLLAVPLFVFLGLLIEMTGMARAMVAFLAGLLGHVRGGLYYVLLGAIYLVSGISGSKAADMAAVAPVLFPEMKQRGAKDGELVAILAASGAMSETIPPSLVLITIGSVTGVSIAALFTGGLLPALVLALALAAVAWWRSRGEALGTRAPAGEIGRAFVIAMPSLLLPFVIRTCGGTRRRHRHRGFHHRHRLCRAHRPTDLSPLRLAAALSDAGGNRGFVWRHPADHRHRHRHGVGADPVRLLPPTRRRHGQRAWRRLRLLVDLNRRLRDPWQRA